LKSAQECEPGVLKDAKRNAQLWEQGSPTFRVKGVRLEELKQRVKNNESTVLALNKIIEEMKRAPADACSGKWQDEEGNPLLAVFANRIPPKGRLSPVAYFCDY
jgi:hypothetical protein